MWFSETSLSVAYIGPRKVNTMPLAAILCGIMYGNQQSLGGDDALKLVRDQVVMVWLSSHLEQAEWPSFRETTIEVLMEVHPTHTPASSWCFPIFK